MKTTEPKGLSLKELVATIDRLEFLVQQAWEGTNTKEMERSLERYKAELKRREGLHSREK